MDTTTIPIQGTFDIALGRRALRTKILAQCWKSTVNARAAAALTALGELILLCSAGKTIPVTMRIIENTGNAGIELSCQVNPQDMNALSHVIERLGKATDNLKLEEGPHSLRITVYVSCSEGKYIERRAGILS